MSDVAPGKCKSGLSSVETGLNVVVWSLPTGLNSSRCSACKRHGRIGASSLRHGVEINRRAIPQRSVLARAARAAPPSANQSQPFASTGTIGAAPENLPPVADRSRVVKQGSEISGDVRYLATPGHSPAHASILFASSLHHREWTPLFDYDPARTINSREAILDRVATAGIMAMGYHFPLPAIGHIVKHDGAYRWEAVDGAW
jgi:glyoxylase-like metal-dependent hydrolase (beta-lactamase superfamily II)